MDAAAFDVVLLPTFAQVEDWRKSHALSGQAGLFGQTVATFNSWIADLWELHGTGSGIVDSLQRQTIMQAAFNQMCAGEGCLRVPGSPDALTLSRGVVKLACRCVRAASGVAAFEQALDDARAGRLGSQLSQREWALLQGIDCYRGLIASADLVELGQAAAFLARNAHTVFPRPLRVLVDHAAPPDWRMRQFFDRCPALSVEYRPAPGEGGVSFPLRDVQVRFAFPSGRYAQPGLVADVVRAALAESPSHAASAQDPAAGHVPVTVVSAADPLALYKQLEHPLVQAGARPCVQAQVPFASTDFGRAFMALARALAGQGRPVEDLSDACRPPFSGFDAHQALRIDQSLRADRLLEIQDCLTRLRIESDTFSQLEELALDPEADILLGVFEQIAFSAPGRSDAWRAEQLSAAAALRSCTGAARRVGAGMDVCLDVLEDVVVRVSFEGAGSDEPRCRVVVTTQQAAARMGAGSCDQLVACDLTSEDYPLSAKDDAGVILFGKLGLQPTDTPLASARRTFAALVALPKRQMVCMRPLNDWDGAPTYPAAVLQELVDAYGAEGADKVFGLPKALHSGLLQRGEELLFANELAAPADALQERSCDCAVRTPGYVSDSKAGCVALRRRLADGSLLPGFSPSPSQVESYLECPAKWFASHRLKVQELDEGFGPIERGSFAHAVLRSFYQQLAERGIRKVDAQSLDVAKVLMRQVAEETARAQAQLEPSSGRYVAASRIEQREIEACIAQLVSYVDFEARFLPGFHPAYLEFPITPSDGVLYGGRPFVGTVDRIDVDDSGRAVIVDYKGSVNSAHEIASATPQAPGKVQTRMYAQVVRRKLGLDVVGAFYVSYGAHPGCAGAFDPRALEAAHLPAARVERCSCAAQTPDALGDEWGFAQLSFTDMLDATERVASAAADAMERGDVEPDPASPEACTYCPVNFCPKRGA